MEYDQLALFLLGYTTGGFRRSLHSSPQATLTQCGFNAAEAAQLAAAMAKHGHGGGAYEVTRVQLTFQQIAKKHHHPGPGMTDNWAVHC